MRGGEESEMKNDYVDHSGALLDRMQVRSFSR
jgi:hypothetical protein